MSEQFIEVNLKSWNDVCSEHDHWRTLALKAKEALEKIAKEPSGLYNDKIIAKEALALFPADEGKKRCISELHGSAVFVCECYRP